MEPARSGLDGAETKCLLQVHPRDEAELCLGSSVRWRLAQVSLALVCCAAACSVLAQASLDKLRPQPHTDIAERRSLTDGVLADELLPEPPPHPPPPRPTIALRRSLELADLAHGRVLNEQVVQRSLAGGIVGGKAEHSRDNIFEVVAKDIYMSDLPGLYQVSSNKQLKVRQGPHPAAKVVDNLEQCEVVSGVAHSLVEGGRQWLRLKGDPFFEGEEGARWAEFDGDKMERMFFTIVSTEGQSCKGLGLHAVDSKHLCQMAAEGIGVQDMNVGETDVLSMPEGCFLFNRSRAIVNSNPKSVGNPSTRVSEIVCSNLKPCAPTTSTTTVTNVASETSTSTVLTTETDTRPTTTVTFTSPSLFCFALAEAYGYEADLLRFARKMRTSIYGCDQHLSLTDDEIDIGTKDDPEITLAIGSLKCEKGSWGSWANAGVFLKGWKAVMKDGRYKRNDWVVKVDADTVFHPNRLKQHVMNVPGVDDKTFFQNFLDGYPVIGALEIASKSAIVDMSERTSECEQVAYGAEDDWFVKCMRVLGAWQRQDQELLQHEDHPQGNMCWNPRFVAMHPYKDKNQYKVCLDQAEGNWQR